MLYRELGDRYSDAIGNCTSKHEENLGPISNSGFKRAFNIARASCFDYLQF